MLPVLPVVLLLQAASGILLPPSEGCRYRKVSLQASLLEASDPLEGWLTLDGKPCNPSSRFHWRPSVVAPTVSYKPVEASKWASAADTAAGNDRSHQKEFLKAQGLDVTEDEIRKALPSITTAPSTSTLDATTVSFPVSQDIPEGVLEGYSPGHISVNVTDADRFVQDAKMMQKIKEILANRTGLKADYFRINYTKLHDGDAVSGGFLQVVAVPLDVVEAGITASIPESDEEAAAKWQSVKENDLYKAVQDAYKEMVHEDRLAVRYSPTPTDADTVAQVVSRLHASPRRWAPTAAPTAVTTRQYSAPAAAPTEAPSADISPAPAPESRSKDLDQLHQLEKKLEDDKADKADKIPHERSTSTPVPSEIDKLNQKMEKLAEQLSAHNGEQVRTEISTSPAPIPKQVDAEVEKLGDKLDSLTKKLRRSPAVPPQVTPVQRQINQLNEKMDKLSDQISSVGAPSQAGDARPKSPEVDAQIDKMNEQMDTLRDRIKSVGRKTKTLEDLNHAHTWKLEDIDHKVDQLAKKLGDTKVEHMGSLRGKIDHLLKNIKEADAVSGTVVPPRLRVPPAAPVPPGPAPAFVIPVSPSMAPAPAVAVPSEAKVMKEVAKVLSRSAPSAPAPAPGRQATGSLSGEVRAKMQQIEDKIDQLGKRFGQASEAVIKAQKPDQAFMNSHVAQVAKVELMDVKTDVQQEILTHAFDGKAQMKGQVEAANHQRKDILRKLNVTIEKRLSKARLSLDDAESQVAETARHVVQEVVKNVTEGFAGVRDVGTDAYKLKVEAESLQNNISALLSHVEQDSGLAAEIVAQLPDSKEVVSEVRKITADVKDIHAQAEEVEELAGESLAAAETAIQVLNRSDVIAKEAKDLKLKAAKQVAENRAKILEIAEIFGSKAL